MQILGYWGILLPCMIVLGCSASSKQSSTVQSRSQAECKENDCGDRIPDLPLPKNPEPSSNIAAKNIIKATPIPNAQVPSSGRASCLLSLLDEEQAIITFEEKSLKKETSIPEAGSLASEQSRDSSSTHILQTSISEEEQSVDGPLLWDAELIPPPIEESNLVLHLQDVIDSVYVSYPLLEAAFLSRQIADGKQLSAQGAFDLKLKGGGTSGPLGFYKTHRFGAGASQPLFSGGEIFGGYKVGRGNFQPWFKERQTDEGGEFSAGISIPLSQNRQIDERRAAQFRATYGRNAVEPDIQTQIIAFVWESSYAYWQWVAAGQNQQIAQSLLEIAQERNEGLKKRITLGDLPPIELTDNQRLIVTRQAALIDADRKLQQSAIKLSLFLRTPDGQPIIPTESQLPGVFPEATFVDPLQMEGNIQLAISNRPELRYLYFTRRQLDVDLAQAHNLYLPVVNAVLFVAKDVGAASSFKRDKTPFEFEASLQLSVPLQRRKALGKIQSIEGKLNQLSIKIRFTQDKISTEVQAVYAALLAAYERITRARESLELARTMEQAERRKFDLGNSDLFLVNLRELSTAKAAKTVLESMLDYFQARVDYRAAIALDVQPEGEPKL